MEMDTPNKLTALHDKAVDFLERNKKAYIKTTNGNYYFAEVTLVAPIYISIYNFAGKRMGEQTELYFMDIETMEEYKEISK